MAKRTTNTIGGIPYPQSGGSVWNAHRADDRDSRVRGPFVVPWTCVVALASTITASPADGEREWADDRQSSVGRLDKALDETTAKHLVRRQHPAGHPALAHGEAPATSPTRPRRRGRGALI
jgi:hypothetical protein